jgi:hypothetical protein
VVYSVLGCLAFVGGKRVIRRSRTNIEGSRIPSAS